MITSILYVISFHPPLPSHLLPPSLFSPQKKKKESTKYKQPSPSSRALGNSTFPFNLVLEITLLSLLWPIGFLGFVGLGRFGLCGGGGGGGGRGKGGWWRDRASFVVFMSLLFLKALLVCWLRGGFGDGGGEGRMGEKEKRKKKKNIQKEST